MESGKLATIGARLGWVVALAGVISASLVLVAGSAQAGLEPAGAPLAAGADPATAGGTGGSAHKRASEVPGGERESERVAPPRRERPQPRSQRSEPRPPHSEPRLGEVENAAGEPLSVANEECKRNLAIAAKQGLRLPDGWKLNCVGPGLDWNGGSHWGVTCPYESCPEGSGPYVSISNPTYYVVAHELCHANFGNDELMADRCAADHGASLESSPYQ